MIIKCGTDIVEINRIKESIEKYGDRFLNRIFTESEIKYCESKKNQKYQHYAGRFAAKEAIFKALSDNISEEDNWKNFEILNTKSGRPRANIYIKAEALENIDISISHCKEYATANAVASFKSKS